MDLRLLGPLSIVGPGAVEVALGGPRDRALLAVLALAANRVVSEGALIDALWGDEPPRTAPKVLQNLVMRLRKRLPVGVSIVTHAGGYELRVDPDRIDLLRVERWVSAARRARQAGNLEKAASLLREALASWRGEALVEFYDFPFGPGECARLAELRLSVLEGSVEVELARGRHAEVVAELEAAAAANRLRERLWALLMVALYRSGRQAEALRAYQQLRTQLAEELGLEPSPELVDLERAVLAHSAELAWAPPRLPSGTVTFLVCEIDAAAQLAQQLGERYPVVAGEVAQLLREACSDLGGAEVASDGERFVVVFAEAADAVAAATRAQLAAASRQWPATATHPRLRMALHTGAATPAQGRYLAPSVQLCARLATAIHGGQVVMTTATAEAASELPPDVELADLGACRLRDFPGELPLRQLCHPALPAVFPPLRASPALAHNLPRYRTALVGRIEEMSALAGLLDQTGLVTLVGPGGVGKTRLAVEVALAALDHYPDGAFMVELGPVADPGLVPAAAARVLGVEEQAGRSLVDTVVDELASRHLLLVLDNCEQVLEGAAALASAVSQRCPQVAVLATSRESLRIDGEAVWRLASLRTPESHQVAILEAQPGATRWSPAALADYDSVRLFVDSAQAVRPGFEIDAGNAAAIAEICRRLDGIPLALELAAARVGFLTVGQIAQRLEHRFDLLSAGRRSHPPRQQTLRAAIDWSYDLLGPAEQGLFAELAVFAGPFSLEAAAAVVASQDLSTVSDLLAALVDKCLVAVDLRGEEANYRLLETIRAYALERLEAIGQAASSRTAHLRWCLSLAEAAAARLHGPRQREWLGRLENHHDDLRAALGWAEDRPELTDELVRMTAALTPFWMARGHWTEGRRWLALAKSRAPEASAAAAEAAGCEAVFVMYQGDYETASSLLQESLAVYRAAADTLGLATAVQRLGLLACQQGDQAAASDLLSQALERFRQLGDRQGMATSLRALSRAARRQGAYEDAQVHLEQALGLFREMGDAEGTAGSLQDLGRLATRQGREEAARQALREALDRYQALANVRGIALCLHALGLLGLHGRDEGSARAHLAEAWRLFSDLHDAQSAAFSRHALALLALRHDNHHVAEAELTEVLATARRLGCKPLEAAAARGLGDLARARGETSGARELYRQALAIGVDTGYRADTAVALEQLAGVEGQGGDARLAARLFGAAAALREAARSPLPSSERAQRDRDVEVVQAALDPVEFSSAWSEGATTPLEETVRLALSVPLAEARRG